jgi:arsenate reductase
MAEAFLKKHGSYKFDVFSAGLNPSEIHPYTKKVMKERGMNLEGQYSKSFKLYMGKKHFAYLITVCEAAEKECPSTFPGVVMRLHWPFDDPASAEGTEEQKLQKFREVRNQIENQILDWLTGFNKKE